MGKTYTNAPRHWPTVTLEPTPNPAVAVLLVAAALKKGLEASGPALAFLRTYVYEDGILEVPLVIREGDTTTCVFIYATPGRNAPAHFSGARAILKAREQVNVVFFALEPVTPVPPAPVLQPIDTPMFSRLQQAPADARYALWWATPEDPSFTTSGDRALIDQWFEGLDGYGYLLFSSFARLLGLTEPAKDGTPTIVRMPEQPFLLAVEGPGAASLLLNASTPEGLFLAFDTATVTARQRRTLLTLLARLATSFRANAGKHAAPRDDGELGLSAWRAIRDEALEREAAGQTGLTVHGVEVSGGQPLRTPNARTAEEQAATPRLPASDVLTFGLDLLERTSAGLQQRVVYASSAEQLGGPNFHAAIVVRAGGQVWQRELPYDDPPLVLEEVADVHQDWPGADIVAVLMDGAIRTAEGGERVDVVRVLVQGADGLAADTFQRYAAGEGGSFSLVGRPSASPIAAFVPPPLPPPLRPMAPPDVALWRIVDKALETASNLYALERDRASTIESPSGATPRMPVAIVDRGGEQGNHVAFAMQGPLRARRSCRKMLSQDAAASSVVFWIDELLHVDGVPARRLRLCAQRRGDPSAALVDQWLEPVNGGTGVVFKGPRTFARWTAPLFG